MLERFCNAVHLPGQIAGSLRLAERGLAVGKDVAGSVPRSGNSQGFLYACELCVRNPEAWAQIPGVAFGCSRVRGEGTEARCGPRCVSSGVERAIRVDDHCVLRDRSEELTMSLRCLLFPYAEYHRAQRWAVPWREPRLVCPLYVW